MERVKIGVVGCGDVAIHRYLPEIVSLVREQKVDLLSVCDSVEERAKQAKEQFGAKEYYSDYGQMLEKSSIEGIVNLTSIPKHFEVSLSAIKANKHVYTEKPMANRLEDASILVEEANRVKVKFACAPPIILAPRNRWVKEMIHKGSIGKVCFIRAHSSHCGPASFDNFLTDPTWFYKEGGGPLYDMGIYQLHLLTDIMGPAKKVFSFAGVAIPEVVVRSGIAKGKKIDVTTHDNIMILLDFGEARFASIDGSYCVKAEKVPAVEFYGSEGTIYLANHKQKEIPPIEAYIERKEFGLRGWVNPCPVPPRRSFPLAPMNLGDGVRHFVECIIEDTQPLISAEHARHVVEIMVKAVESAETGRAMDLFTRFE